MQSSTVCSLNPHIWHLSSGLMEAFKLLISLHKPSFVFSFMFPVQELSKAITLMLASDTTVLYSTVHPFTLCQKQTLLKTNTSALTCMSVPLFPCISRVHLFENGVVCECFNCVFNNNNNNKTTKYQTHKGIEGT